MPAKAGAYSINRGLWGTTWGGGWTHDTWAGPPAELLDPPADAPAPREIVLALGARAAGRARRRRAGRARRWSPRLGELARGYGIGRNIHVGETALGIKGRIGFEAGAALLLIGAHRELEKLVLTKWQAFWKDQLGRFYGDRLHEGQYFDPVAPRHRGADHQLAGAGHRRDPRAPRARAGSRWSAPGARTR